MFNVFRTVQNIQKLIKLSHINSFHALGLFLYTQKCYTLMILECIERDQWREMGPHIDVQLYHCLIFYRIICVYNVALLNQYEPIYSQYTLSLPSMFSRGQRKGALGTINEQLSNLTVLGQCSQENNCHQSRFVPNAAQSLPTNTPRVFHVDTTWKRSFPGRFNVEYTWCVCRATALEN